MNRRGGSELEIPQPRRPQLALRREYVTGTQQVNPGLLADAQRAGDQTVDHGGAEGLVVVQQRFELQVAWAGPDHRQGDADKLVPLIRCQMARELRPRIEEGNSLSENGHARTT